MSDYVAPVKEISFVLNELADLQDVCSLPAYQESTEDVIAAVLEEAGKFATGVLEPLNEVGDNQGAACDDNAVTETPGFAAAYQQFVEGGWASLPCNPEFGGMGLPHAVNIATTEMWSSSNLSFALCPMLTQGAINSIESHGSDELKATYLEKMISGEWTGTMNLTEPQAGSDLSVVRTKAVPEGDHYRLTGTKIFITWGDHQMTENVIHLVLARTPDAPEGVRGISLFVVPKFLVNDDGSIGERNDAYATSVEHKLGIHASPTCVINFGDTDGAIGYLVGEENQGLGYMFTMMNHARLGVGAQGVALSERAYQHAVAYAQDRVQGKAAGDAEKGAIIRHPDVRRMLLTMRAYAEASRALCYVTATAFDMAHHAADENDRAAASARGELLTPLAKGWSTEIAQEATSLGVQVHGGMGYVEETGAAQFMRDVRITTIYEGTTGIQAGDLIGRKLLRDKGAAFKSLLADIRATHAEVANAGAGFSVVADALQTNVDVLEQEADSILAGYENDPRLDGAVSGNFLMAAGTIVGGWLLAKGALIAQAKRSEDEHFYSAKIITCQFYAEHIMPRAEAYLKAVSRGSETIMALADDQF